MNKKASIGIAVIVSIFVMIIGFSILSILEDEVTRARTNLNCSDRDNISDGNKLTCLISDTVIIYWIIIILGAVIGGLTSKLIFK